MDVGSGWQLRLSTSKSGRQPQVATSCVVQQRQACKERLLGWSQQWVSPASCGSSCLPCSCLQLRLTVSAHFLTASTSLQGPLLLGAIRRHHGWTWVGGPQAPLQQAATAFNPGLGVLEGFHGVREKGGCRDEFASLPGSPASLRRWSGWSHHWFFVFLVTCQYKICVQCWSLCTRMLVQIGISCITANRC